MQRDINRDMWSYLPNFYEDIRESRAIINPESKEFERLDGNIRDVLSQFFVDTATWGLANWERVFDIAADETKPIDQRRSVIKSKMRGAGTVTISLIEEVAEAYDNGDVDVVLDHANYIVTITFISTKGIPPNLADIENALREIIPAHLAIDFVFTYLTWDELDSANLTWDDLDALGLTWDQFEVYNPNL